MIFIPVKEVNSVGDTMMLRCLNVAEIECFSASSLLSDHTYIRLRSGFGICVDMDIETFADVLDDYIKAYPDGGVAPISEGGVKFDRCTQGS